MMKISLVGSAADRSVVMAVPTSSLLSSSLSLSSLVPPLPRSNNFTASSAKVMAY